MSRIEDVLWVRVGADPTSARHGPARFIKTNVYMSTNLVKRGDPEDAYDKATKAELEQNWDLAFKSYVQAVELFLHASRTTTDNEARAGYKAQAAKSLDRAEKIKLLKRNLTPVPVDRFSEQQQYYVLDKSSLINGRRFNFWDKPAPGPNDCDDQPRFSLEQIQCSAEWRRPQDLSPKYHIYSTSLEPIDITQFLVGDCSVCSSVAVCIEHGRRFGTKLGLSSIYPQYPGGVPHASPDGHYSVRVLFNGTYRRVNIDDQLPFSPDGVPLCMSAAKGELWPCMIGKAYVKLNGDYEFPGSTSSIDLHAITGWIPEHLEFQSPSFEREITWNRLCLGFTEGRCLVTVGTDKRHDIQWNGRRLLPAHCYAVINVQEVNGERMLTLLDPLDPLRCRDGEEAVNSQFRTWEMSWDEACGVFHSIYFSWDPSLFPHQLTFHGIWKSHRSGEASKSHTILKLRRTSSSESDLWAVLTRHVVDRQRTSEYISLRVEKDGTLSDYMSINKLASQGMYINSPHTLVRTRLQGSEDFICVLASYDGDFDDTAYTVTVYSTAEVSWDKTVPPPTHVKKVEGTLSMKTAGGSCLYPTFMLNPQYCLRIHADKSAKSKAANKGRVDLLLHGDRGIPLNVTVLWSRGQRITEFSPNDVALGSGPYSYGVAHVKKDLLPGDYTVVVSAFEPDQQSKFSLQVESAYPFDLEPIPQEGAGMYNKTIRGAWDDDTATGAPPYNRYFSNPLFEVQVKSQTQLKVRLQLTQSSSITSINISLFRDSSPPQLLLSSGPYADTICGVITPQISLAPGNYFLVPSTYEPGFRTPFRIIVYCTTSGVAVSRRKRSGNR
ncbi:cysteine proteinase [Neolentinus lepideus HHB14362 ss-1]|uniref:Cysteine proteinase n=1 Tax=Neolentinus lepideus HHB14362 ss-1 TaxID=1314782 RepID=A0A165QJ07_9AGAM|nr:cysteine proteinase [Neolentinus lepideus HHB14362 ss-1]